MTALTDNMTFGIFLAPFHRVGENPTLALERDLELLEWLDALGYDEAWIGEHHSGGWETIASPEVFIATAAGRTSRLRLGTGVVSLPYHNPYMVANRMVLLDHLTRGRVMLGVGPGSLASDAYMFCIDPERQREMMDESLGVIMKLFEGQEPVHLRDRLVPVAGSLAAAAPLSEALPARGRGLGAVAGGRLRGRQAWGRRPVPQRPPFHDSADYPEGPVGHRRRVCPGTRQGGPPAVVGACPCPFTWRQLARKPLSRYAWAPDGW